MSKPDTSRVDVASWQEGIEAAAKVAEGEVYKERYRTWVFSHQSPDGTRGNASADCRETKHSDRIAAAIRSLTPPERAASPSGESGWRPIESAPKDGTFVLGYGPHKTRGYYLDAIHFFGDRFTIEWMEGHGSPTHWMPLPAPPAPHVPAGEVGADDGLCTMGVGCDEVGVCYAAAQGQPDHCHRRSIAPPAPDVPAQAESGEVEQLRRSLGYMRTQRDNALLWAERADKILYEISTADEETCVNAEPPGKVLAYVVGLARKYLKGNSPAASRIRDLEAEAAASRAEVEHKQATIQDLTEALDALDGHLAASRTEAERWRGEATKWEGRAYASRAQVDALAGALGRVTDHLNIWAGDHSEEATPETWAAIYCARAVLAAHRAGSATTQTGTDKTGEAE